MHDYRIKTETFLIIWSITTSFSSQMFAFLGKKVHFIFLSSLLVISGRMDNLSQIISFYMCLKSYDLN